jgi:hypothetical protein
MSLRKLMLAIVVLLVLPSIGHSQVDSSFFSGFEVFPGVRADKTTIGASFAGWSNDAQQPGTSGGENCAASSGDWTDSSNSTGGAIHGSLNYQGKPGFGHTVNVTSGRWFWLEDNHMTHHGRILKGGIVSWPSDPNSTVDASNLCGCGVAQFTIPISLGKSHSQAGTITGCLNDQLVFPPKIWGEITLTSAP